MSCLSVDPVRSTFDLPFEAANDRIAAFHDERHRARAAASPVAATGAQRIGLVLRARMRLGRGLIALGSAIAPNPSRTQARAGRGSVVSR